MRKRMVGLDTTKSGLLVPAHVAEEQRNADRVTERWLMDEFKSYLKVAKHMLKKRIALQPGCLDCNESLEYINTAPGRAVLRCKCKDRILVAGI
jgi:hypothetical protein